jgi:AcrR family transcriptional regulator
MPVTPIANHGCPGRGRPRLHNDDKVLGVALEAFAVAGFDAMSMRALSRELGLSHGALNQRFGSKKQLFFDAVDHGFGGLLASMSAHRARWPSPQDDRVALRDWIRSFLLASAEHPELVRLMNTEGIGDSARLDYIFATYIGPNIELIALGAATSRPSAVRRMTTREFFFLVTHGAAAPFTLQALSGRFGERWDPQEYAEHMAELLLRILGD